MEEDYELPAEFHVENKLFHELTEKQLMNIQQWFLIDPLRRMNKYQLRKVLEVVGDLKFTNDEYNTLYDKINFESDDYVSWDEFITFLIQNFEHKLITKDMLGLLDPICQAGRLLKSHHRYPVISLRFNPTVFPDRSTSWFDGSIITASHDGFINYWTLDMRYDCTVRSVCPNLRVQSTQLTDIVPLPDVNILCCSTTEGELRFYDTSARKFELRVSFIALPCAIVRMDYSFYKDAHIQSTLVMGDMGGNIHILRINSLDRGPFQSKLGLPLLEVRYDSVMKGLVDGFQVQIWEKVHYDFVDQVRYYPALNRVISVSACETYSIVMTDMKDGYRRYVFRNTKGSWCFDITEKVSIFVTGGSDCLVKIWNPLVTLYPTGVLYGHRGGIVSLKIQDEGKFLYSLSEDKCIKVWDLSTQSCLQNYLDLPTGLGECMYLRTLYNPENREWILGCYSILVLPLNPKMNPDYTDGTTLTSVISVVLYNPLFKFVITCGIDSYIIVWNPWDGRRLVTIKAAHIQVIHAVDVPIPITAAAFDPPYQRLITGAHDGTLKIWNFNSATCLLNLRLDDSYEIKSIIWVKERILCVGWNKRVFEFADIPATQKSDTPFCKLWDKRHTENISACVVRVPETLVTCTYNGEMIMWKLETGQPYKQYNVNQPTQRVKIQYKLAAQKQAPQKPAVPVSESGRVESAEDMPSVEYSSRVSMGSITSISQSISTRRHSLRKVMETKEFIIPSRILGVHSLLFLNARKTHPKSGTLLAGVENGLIHVYSHHPSGEFIDSFSAVHRAGDFVLSMATDIDNMYLFTGSNCGYLKTWYLKDYCILNDEKVIPSLPRLRLQFPFLWGDRILGRAQRAVIGQRRPILLNSFRAHVGAITSLVYVDQVQIIITGSTDGSVRMWTLNGRYYQTIGTFKDWKPIHMDIDLNKSFKHTIPPELQRSGSSTSLRVLGGGESLWKNAKSRRSKSERHILNIDQNKIYGTRLTDPILGNYYIPTTRSTLIQDVTFDETFPYIPVYQHLIMPPVEKVEMNEVTPFRDEGDET